MTSIDVIASALEPVTPMLSRMSLPDGAVTLMLSDIAAAGAAAEELGPSARLSSCAITTCWSNAWWPATMGRS